MNEQYKAKLVPAICICYRVVIFPLKQKVLLAQIKVDVITRLAMVKSLDCGSNNPQWPNQKLAVLTITMTKMMMVVQRQMQSWELFAVIKESVYLFHLLYFYFFYMFLFMYVYVYT